MNDMRFNNKLNVTSDWFVVSEMRTKWEMCIRNCAPPHPTRGLQDKAGCRW